MSRSLHSLANYLFLIPMKYNYNYAYHSALFACQILFLDIKTEQKCSNYNDSVCLQFPKSTSQCNFGSTSLFLSISHDCNIRIYPEVNPMKYECYRRFNLFNVTVNGTARDVCLSNWNLRPNGTVVWFMCMDKCLQPNCKATYNYVSSYQILTGN